MKAKLSKHLSVLLLVVLLIVPASVAAQTTVTEEWVARYNGPAGSTDIAVAVAIAVDGAGNVYVTGYSQGIGTGADYATVKYDAGGAQQWVARYDGPGHSSDEALAIAVDGPGNVYVAGHSDGGSTGLDYATVKYDASGTEQWVARYNGPANFTDIAYDIAVDGSGNVYVTGRSDGVGTGADYATVKYDASGAEQWVARYDGPASSADEARAIAVDGPGNVYVTGHSNGGSTGADYATLKYDGSGTTPLWVARYDGPANFTDMAYDIAVGGSGNVYVTGRSDGISTGADYATVKYDANGNELWTPPARRYYGTVGLFVDEARAIVLDGSENVYVTGYTYNSSTGADYATVKYDAGGTQLWVAGYDGPANSTDSAEAIALDAAGNVYVTGHSHSLSTGADYATVKYDASGTQLWVAGYDGPANSTDRAEGIAVDGSGNVYVTGYSQGIGTGADYATMKYSQADNLAPAVGLISAPVDPVQVDTEINASADFTDPDVLDTHTALWDWGDGSQCDTTTDSECTVTEDTGSGSVTGSHTYTVTGVYTVTLTVTDNEGESGQSVFQYIVVYDPSGGFVTGGGWIDSPAGAYTPDPSLTGRAKFGFVSKYKKDAPTPSGKTKFRLRVADMDFRSTSYQWLVITGTKARFRGEGTVNGEGEYGLMLTATDEKVGGGGDEDRFRIRIWDEGTGAILYDNQMGAEEDADPTQVIGAGNIHIHNK